MVLDENPILIIETRKFIIELKEITVCETPRLFKVSSFAVDIISEYLLIIFL